MPGQPVAFVARRTDQREYPGLDIPKCQEHDGRAKYAFAPTGFADEAAIFDGATLRPAQPPR